MPATHRIDNESKVLITAWEGHAEDTELFEVVKKYQDDIQLSPEYIDYNEVADFRTVESIKVTPTGLKQVGEMGKIADKFKPESKLAIVVSSNIAFNIARMYASLRNAMNNNKEIRIFKDFDAAFEWASLKD